MAGETEVHVALFMLVVTDGAVVKFPCMGWSMCGLNFPPVPVPKEWISFLTGLPRGAELEAMYG